MARWLAVASVAAHHGSGGVQSTTPQVHLVAMLASVVLMFVCVTKLVGLCAAHGNPQVLNRESEPEGELAAEAAAAAAALASSRKLSYCFSPAAIQAKLSSFRNSSFRNHGSFRKSSFRSSSNGSFRLDCASQVDVVDALRPVETSEEPDDPTTGLAVWQRAILRGERCAPLEFSGLILYDEKGNHLPLRNGAPPRPILPPSSHPSSHPSSRPYRSTTVTK